MKKLKIKRKKELFPKNSNVRVKNSYYTFSKEYPAAKIIQTKRVKRKKERTRSALHAVLATVCFVLIAAVSFFAVKLGLNFSNKPIGADSDFSSTAEGSEETLFQTGSLKALYMPYQKIANRRELASFIKKIRRRDCNAVVLDFKTDAGKLLYSSQTELARSGKCAIFDNETVKTALGEFEEKNIAVVARFFCFEDEIASQTDPDLAVKYMNTDVLWRDDISNGEGKTWLNPYSKKAKAYLTSLLSEISSLGVSGIILESVSFPKADISSAGFPGEKRQSGRSKALLEFVEEAKSAVSNGCFLLIGETASDILGTGDENFFQEILKSDADGICADTRLRPESFVADRKSGYSSMLSMFSQIKQKQTEASAFVPVIDMDEYSRKYVRVMGENGFESFILFDESGKY